MPNENKSFDQNHKSQGTHNAGNRNQQNNGLSTTGASNTGSANIALILKSSVSTALSEVAQVLGPQINQYAHDFANDLSEQLISHSERLIKSAYVEVKRRPMVLIGAGAVLLLGAAVFIQMGGTQESEFNANLHS